MSLPTSSRPHTYVSAVDTGAVVAGSRGPVALYHAVIFTYNKAPN